jgi:hypothetical protein
MSQDPFLALALSRKLLFHSPLQRLIDQGVSSLTVARSVPASTAA